MVCSNCKRLFIETGVRHSHITQGNIRTCPQIGGYLYVKPKNKIHISKLNTNDILKISSYLTYFETQTIFPLVSKQFEEVVNTLPKAIKRTIKMKKNILRATLFQLNRTREAFPAFDIELFLTFSDKYIAMNAPDAGCKKNLMAYKKITKEISELQFKLT